MQIDTRWESGLDQLSPRCQTLKESSACRISSGRFLPVREHTESERESCFCRREAEGKSFNQVFPCENIDLSFNQLPILASGAWKKWCSL
jgi:hypothetical protein